MNNPQAERTSFANGAQTVSLSSLNQRYIIVYIEKLQFFTWEKSDLFAASTSFSQYANIFFSVGRIVTIKTLLSNETN